MKHYDNVFHSIEDKAFEEYEIPRSVDKPTTIFFEVEKIIVKININGLIEFLSCEGETISSIHNNRLFDASNIDDDVYGYSYSVECGIEDNKIILKFKRTEQIDYYPHCDGEYDRWGSCIRNLPILIYDLLTSRGKFL